MQRHTVYLYLETVLHVSGGTTTHHQERVQLYLQHLVFVRPLLLPAAIATFCIYIDKFSNEGKILMGVAIASGSSNGLTNTRCCR
jgi:hypothetical protein